MTNEFLIEALDGGLIMVKTDNYTCISCVGIECENCKLYSSQRMSCRIIANEVSEENLEFLKENYPEHLLKIYNDK